MSISSVFSDNGPDVPTLTTDDSVLAVEKLTVD